MTYQATNQQNATASKTATLALLAAYVGKRLSTIQFVQAAVATIAAASARAITLADIAAAKAVNGLGQSNALPLGLLLPATEPARLEQALSTVLGSDPDGHEMRVGRLALSTPLAAGQQAFQDASAEHGVDGWTRVARPEACALCRGLADGTVLPINRTMYAHPGCDCVAKPVELKPTEAPREAQPAKGSRELSTGYGLYRRTYRSPRRGLTFVMPTPSRGRVP